MKTRRKPYTRTSLLAASCFLLTTMAVFGQTTYIWTNPVAIDIGLSTNWNPVGLPSGATQDTAEWNGVVSGNLLLYYNTGWGNSGFGTSGVNFDTTTSQTGNVQITTTLSASPAAGVFGIDNESPSGILHIGEPGTAHQLSLATRPGTAGTVHSFVNNSSQAAILDSSITWVAGGGVACVMDFSGTGNWIVNHACRDDNSGAGPVTVQWDGPGTMIWSNGGTFLASDPLGPIIINNGTVILNGAGLAQNFTGVPVGNNTIQNNGNLLEYNASVADNIARVISGTGALQVNNGQLTLSGANTYSGNTILSGGEVIVGVAENLGTSGPLGTNNTISFNGGVLGFSLNNKYDYSPRFSTAAGQAYYIDNGGFSVTLTNALTSSGGTLTSSNSGTLTLTGANTYGGLTTVNSGTLEIQGSAGSGPITVANSATLGVTETGPQITPSTLTVGTSASAGLQFNNVSSAVTPPIAVTGAVSVPAGSPININVTGGTFLIGQHYPLLSFSGTPPGVNLQSLVGAVGNLSTNGNTIQLNITSLAFVWSGLNNADWDISTPNNWKVNGVAQTFANGGSAVFDDTVPSANTNVILNTPVSPGSVTVSSSAKTYSITASGANLIGGTGGLTKNGNSTLTLSGGVNTYSGATTINGGVVSVGTLASGGTASDIGAANNTAASLVLNGGTLQYTGAGATSDHLFTLGTGGGTLDDEGGTLTLTSSGAIALSGAASHALTLTGSDPSGDTLAALLADYGVGNSSSLTKDGAGTWILTANNSYSGGTVVNNGTLVIGTGGAGGSLGSGNILDNSSLDFNVSSTITNGTITGTGSLTNDGSGTLVMPGNNVYSGGTTINNGTVQVGIGGVTGQLNASAPVTDNGTLIVNSTGNSTLSGIISGTGNLIKRGSGLLTLLGANTYTGWTFVDSGAQLQLWQGNTGANVSSAITNNGSLLLLRQDNGVAVYTGPISGTGKLLVEVSNGNNGDSTLTGSNTYTGGTFILGGGLILGDDATPGGGSILGNVYLTNDTIHATFSPFVPALLTFNRPDDFTFPGNIVGQGSLTQEGNDILTLTGANDYTNGTTITAGTLQVGNGGTTGSAGSYAAGNAAIADNSLLVFNRSDSVTVGNVINGSGSLVQEGAGTLTLAGGTTYTGSTTVSNGTLIVGSSVGGDLDAYGGTLLVGGAGSVTNVSVGGNMNIAAGAVVATLNKSLSPSNTVYTVAGTLISSGGTLNLVNAGPALVVGDTFTIFSEAVTGSALTIVSPGYTFANHLAVDGSVMVTGITGPPTLSFTKVGNSLQFSWTGGAKLQAQTNSLSGGLRNNWGDYPGGSTSPITVPITTNASVFFRLVTTP